MALCSACFKTLGRAFGVLRRATVRHSVFEVVRFTPRGAFCSNGLLGPSRYSSGLYKFIRGFRWAYNRGSLYAKGLMSGIKISFGKKLTKIEIKER